MANYFHHTQMVVVLVLVVILATLIRKADSKLILTNLYNQLPASTNDVDVSSVPVESIRSDNKATRLLQTGTQMCNAGTLTNTGTAVQNFATCNINVCGGTQLFINGCPSSGGGSSNSNGVICQGDTYIKLFKGNAQDVNTDLVAENDNGCGSTATSNPNGFCSSLRYTVPSSWPCQTLQLRMGCAGVSQCTATYQVSGVRVIPPSPQPTTATPTVTVTPRPSAVPTFNPSAQPTVKATAFPTARFTTSPTLNPTVKATASPTLFIKPSANPTRLPTVRPTLRRRFLCAPYTATNTNSAG